MPATPTPTSAGANGYPGFVQTVTTELRTVDRGEDILIFFLLKALASEADRDEKGFATMQDASRHATSGV